MPDADTLDTARRALTDWDHVPPDVLATTLRTRCTQRGHGTWIDPGARPGDTAATHLHEIDLYGVSASGHTPEEAARNWMRVARSLCAGVAA